MAVGFEAVAEAPTRAAMDEQDTSFLRSSQLCVFLKDEGWIEGERKRKILLRVRKLGKALGLVFIKVSEKRRETEGCSSGYHLGLP